MAGAAGGFVTRAFESMLKESSGKKYVAVQKAIQAYLDCITETNQQAVSTVKENTTMVSAGHTLEGAQSELILQPLRLAFETKNTKLIESALDCFHKLIAYDHLEGDPGLEGGQNAALFTDILNMVCNCVDNSSPDSTILQVLKVLLTAVASAKFRVHGEPLLGVIRVCYNIALNSKSPVNQATSKAMLIQMISIIFRRMESKQIDGTINNSINSNNMEITMDDQEEKKTIWDSSSMNCKKEESHMSVEELQILAGIADIKGLEVVLDKAVNLMDKNKHTGEIDLEGVSIAERDALLLFHTLCKMGMKEENDDATTKIKHLSLELLQGLLEGVDHSITKNIHFIDSVKAYLPYALLRASISSSPATFEYAAGIFAVLLLRFRENLKGEIGVFFPLIVLRWLDSSDSPLNQRASILRMLEKVCKDAQMLADIFVNYDCDLEAPNLFERMVSALSRISQWAVNGDPNSVIASQIASVKGLSLQCLVCVLKSLVYWEKFQREVTENKKTNLSIEEEEVMASGSVSTDDYKSMEDGPRHFENDKAYKSMMEAAISEFTHQPAKAIEFLMSNKLIENSAASVAQFLKNTPTLDKVATGEYLGQHEEFPLAVMHAYVNSLEFSGLRFDAAFNNFLSGFHLPREAQKIDRIIEKFADRYCADNPGLFKNAETAYALAYAIIMLRTDTDATKMSKSDFIRMIALSVGEECAPKELLEEIYDSIVKEELKMNSDIYDVSKRYRQKPDAEERQCLVSILNLTLPRRQSTTDSNAEREQIIKQTQALFRNQIKRGVFLRAQQIELVRPMLEAVGWPFLAAFSVIMEEGDNKARVLLCMEGLKFVIHATHILQMDTTRYAFLTSLVRFTLLHAPRELCSKNVEALRTLLALCDTERDALQDSWSAVLECVSRLDFVTSAPAIASTVMQRANQISRDAVLQSLRDLAGKPTEQVFVNSVRLPSESVVEFFTALCAVSAEELKQIPARVFSLQKLVEISYYNMARIHLVWSRIWSVLACQFITAGNHHDEKIAMYAIDSLRQLGMKYLERAELKNFTFQNDILKPFVIIMRNSRSESIHGLIVDCIVQMIRSKVGSIKSGWKSVFMIFTAASDEYSETIIESAFENVEQVILEHFDQVVGDYFMDCVNCLLGFANNKASPRISLKAIALLRICEDRLAEGLVPSGALEPVDARLETAFDVTEHYWFPMLAGLSDLTLDYRLEVRNCALEVLFDFLNERGWKFSSAFWENIFQRVLFPIFDHVRHAERDNLVASGDGWLRDTIIHSLKLLCNLFNTFYKEVSFMLPQLLSLLLDCAKKPDQPVVSISLGALVHLVEVGGHQFSNDDWDKLLKSIRDVSCTTQPLELLNSSGVDNLRDQPALTVATYVDNSDVNAEFDSKDIGTAFDETSLTNELQNSLKDISSFIQDSDMHTRISTHLTDSEGSMQNAREPENLQRSQTFGRRIMGNMMDNILLRSFPKPKLEDVSAPSSPWKVPDSFEPSLKDVDDGEHPLLDTARGKCITQLLLLGALDIIQRKYWSRLNPSQKICIMEVLLSVLEFAASFNSYGNLRMRMHHIPSGRPPPNLLRQEVAGTSIYLDILHKMTSGVETQATKHSDHNPGDLTIATGANEESDAENNLKVLAEEKLVSFCVQILKDASELHSSTGDAANIDLHRVLELRAPVIVKVLKAMCRMHNQIFRNHLGEFYPLITKLMSCNQMDIRGALADLLSVQLTPLLT